MKVRLEVRERLEVVEMVGYLSEVIAFLERPFANVILLL